MLDRNKNAAFTLDASPAENGNGQPYSTLNGTLRQGKETWVVYGRFQFNPETGRKYLIFQTAEQADAEVYVGRLFRDESHRGRPTYKGYLHPRRQDSGNNNPETDWVLEISAESVANAHTRPGSPIILGRAFPPALAATMSYDMLLREAHVPF